MLNHILQQENLEITYHNETIFIYPIAMWFEAGKWFLALFDYEEQDLRVLRCNEIQSFRPTTKSLIVPENVRLADFNLFSFDQLRQKEQQHYFQIKIKRSGIEHYHGKPFPHIFLQLTDDNSALISGHYNKEELGYLLDYINGFSQYLIDIQPEELKRMYIDEIKARLRQLK